MVVRRTNDVAARARRLPRRFSERAVGTFFRASTRVVGLRPGLVPSHMRRQLQVIGIDDETLARVLRNIHRLTDWPYAWEAEGDHRSAEGDFLTAAAAYYVGQRILLTDSPLKRRLYGLTKEAYERAEKTSPLEHLRIEHDGETIVGYLQMPPGPAPASGHPLVLMVPGVTATKEELHPFAEPLLRRGFAVVRIDSPRYGDTTGVLRENSKSNPSAVLAQLAQDPRIDGQRMHLFGMSLGALWVLHSARLPGAASVTAISGGYDPEPHLSSLPAMNLTALMHMTDLPDYEALEEFSRQVSLRGLAADITIPTLLMHGGRDRTIPIGEAYLLQREISGPLALQVWPRDHHNCLEHFDEMLALFLEWLDDPLLVVQHTAAREQAESLQRATWDAVPDTV